ncbi:MAG TPA: hypothetical protein VFG11_02460 [Acidobacteriota bacterium]|nr:hypothetical protein [Acidobacteriota bacterium]
MKRSLLFVAFLICLVLPLVASAVPGKNGKLSVKPYINDPTHTGTIVAAWMPHQGITDSGKSFHALYFQKDELTSVLGFAAAKIKPFSGKDVTELLELGFDYKTLGAHCTTNAPRFVVTVDGTDFNLGCASGVAGVSPDDVNWTRVRFGVTEFSAAGIPTTGTIDALKLIFDEGTDLGTGTVFLDQIDVNGLLIRKSGKGGPKN